MRKFLTIAAVFLVFSAIFFGCAFLVAGSSETEVIRDAKGRPMRIFVCNTNIYTSSCNDNTGKVYVGNTSEVPDAG